MKQTRTFAPAQLIAAVIIVTICFLIAGHIDYLFNQLN